MRSFAFGVAALAAVAAAAPAPAAITVLASDFDLTNGPLTVGLDATNTFTFSFDPIAPFDPDPTLVQTMGTAATTAFGGFLGIPLEPSTFFTDANILVDANIFPGFAQFPDATRIPSSLVAGDLGLRVTIDGQDFFGFARVAGPTVTVAFNTVAGAGINAGAVPEPATWAMLILGFGAVGGAMRRRAKAKVAYA